VIFFYVINKIKNQTIQLDYIQQVNGENIHEYKFKK